MAYAQQLTVSQAIDTAHQAGFTGAGLATIVAIAMSESNLQVWGPDNVNSDGSHDRGILQFNSRWHPEVTDECAHNPQCAFANAYRVSNGGKNFGAWSTYTSGAYLKNMGTINSAVKASNTNASAPWWQQLIQALAPYSNLTPDVQNNAAAGAGDAVNNAINSAIGQAFAPFFSALPSFGIHIALFFGALMLVIVGLWILTRNPVDDTGSAFNRGLQGSAKGIGSAFRKRGES